MGKCPFWSSENKIVSCYDECPMHQDLSSTEECVFKEYLNFENVKVDYKDIINDDLIKHLELT